MGRFTKLDKTFNVAAEVVKEEKAEAKERNQID